MCVLWLHFLESDHPRMLLWGKKNQHTSENRMEFQSSLSRCSSQAFTSYCLEILWTFSIKIFLTFLLGSLYWYQSSLTDFPLQLIFSPHFIFWVRAELTKKVMCSFLCLCAGLHWCTSAAHFSRKKNGFCPVYVDFSTSTDFCILCESALFSSLPHWKHSSFTCSEEAFAIASRDHCWEEDYITVSVCNAVFQRRKVKFSLYWKSCTVVVWELSLTSGKPGIALRSKYWNYVDLRMHLHTRKAGSSFHLLSTATQHTSHLLIEECWRIVK